jgi:hypothetical protein
MRTDVLEILPASMKVLDMVPKIEERDIEESDVALFSCPSWARTRTLLIQSPPPGATFPDNLLGIGHFPSIGARFPAVVCPLVPGETTAKLRQ